MSNFPILPSFHYSILPILPDFSYFCRKFNVLNPLKKLAGQAAIYGLSSIVGRLLNYLLVPLYTRVLITSEYGIVTEMLAYVSILWVILTYGMETTFFRFSESEKDKPLVYHTAIVSLLFTSILFVVVVLINTQSITEWMGYIGHEEYIVYFAFTLALDAVAAIPFARLRQQNKALRFAVIKLVNIGSNILLNLFFVLLCPFIVKNYGTGILAEIINSFFNPDYLIGYIIISYLVTSLLTLVLLFPDIPLRSIRFSAEMWKRMIGYTWPLLVVGIAGSVNLSIDKIMLPRLLPKGSDVMSQLGIYGACYKISIIMTLFVQTFRYAAEPFFFSESGKEGSKKLYADVLNFFTIFVALIFLVTMMFIDIVIGFIGVDYREGASVIPVLLMANLFLGVYFNLSIWYKISNQTIYGAIISVIGAVLNIILNFIFIPAFGYYGSAWAVFLSYFVMMVLSYFLGQRHFPVPYNTRKFFLYLAIPVGLYLISENIPFPSAMIKHFVNSGFVLLYLAIIFKLEKDTLGGLIKGIGRKGKG